MLERSQSHETTLTWVLKSSLVRFLFYPRGIKKFTVLVMSDQIFFLSDQDGVLIGHKSFKRKKLFVALIARHISALVPFPFVKWQIAVK